MTAINLSLALPDSPLSPAERNSPCCFYPFWQSLILPSEPRHEYTLWKGTDQECVEEFPCGGLIVYFPLEVRPEIVVGGIEYELLMFADAGVWISEGYEIKWILKNPADLDFGTVELVLSGIADFQWDEIENVLTVTLWEDVTMAGESLDVVFPAFQSTDCYALEREAVTSSEGAMAFFGSLNAGARGPMPAFHSSPSVGYTRMYFDRAGNGALSDFAILTPPSTYRIDCTSPQMASNDWNTQSFWSVEGIAIPGWIVEPNTSSAITFIAGTYRVQIFDRTYDDSAKKLRCYISINELIGGSWEGFKQGFFECTGWDPRTDLTVDSEGILQGNASFTLDESMLEGDPMSVSWAAGCSEAIYPILRVLDPGWKNLQNVHSDSGILDYSRPFVVPHDLNISISGIVWKEGYIASITASFTLVDFETFVECGYVQFVDEASVAEYRIRAAFNPSSGYFYLQAWGEGLVHVIFEGHAEYDGEGSGLGDALSVPGANTTVSNSLTDFSSPSNIAHSGEVVITVPS